MSKKEIIADDRIIDSIEIELEQAQKVRDQAIKNEFNLKKELEQRDQKLIANEKENQFLKDQLNKLSALFEEQYQILSDLIITNQIQTKNLQNTKQLVDIKIKNFNEDGNKQ